jgi:hypothetical protein
LEKLGFPWILSSESSLFNELQGKFGEKIFLGVSLSKRQARIGFEGADRRYGGQDFGRVGHAGRSRARFRSYGNHHIIVSVFPTA